jgi:transcription factor SPT20
MNGGARAASRPRRDAPSGQLLGRGQRNSSVGQRSASVAGENVAPQNVEPLPYGIVNCAPPIVLY